MARRTTVTTKTTTTRESKAASRKSTDPATEGAPASGGMGLAEAIAIVTTIMLIGAILMTDYFLGHQLGSGVFFKT